MTMGWVYYYNKKSKSLIMTNWLMYMYNDMVGVGSNIHVHAILDLILMVGTSLKHMQLIYLTVEVIYKKTYDHG